MIARVSSPFVRQSRPEHLSAIRAGMIPDAARQMDLRPDVRKVIALYRPRAGEIGTPITTLSIDCLRRGDDDPAQCHALLDGNFVEQSGANTVHLEELTEIRQVVLIGGQVKDDIRAHERPLPLVLVPDIACEDLDAAGKFTGTAGGMHRLNKAIEDSHVMPSGEQGIDGVRSDETCASGHKHSHGPKPPNPFFPKMPSSRII